MTEHRSTTQLRIPLLGSIWGHHEVNRTVSSGLFVCPTEGTERAYWHHRIRNWHTFLSIPVLPGEIVEEYVECFCCGATVDPRVVNSDHPSLQVDPGA